MVARFEGFSPAYVIIIKNIEQNQRIANHIHGHEDDKTGKTIEHTNTSSSELKKTKEKDFSI